MRFRREAVTLEFSKIFSLDRGITPKNKSIVGILIKYGFIAPLAEVVRVDCRVELRVEWCPFA